MSINHFTHETLIRIERETKVRIIEGLVSGGAVWAALFIIGVLTWTLTEYLLHRFVFHWEPSPDSPVQLVLHFLLHGKYQYILFIYYSSLLFY